MIRQNFMARHTRSFLRRGGIYTICWTGATRSRGLPPLWAITFCCPRDRDWRWRGAYPPPRALRTAGIRNNIQHTLPSGSTVSIDGFNTVITLEVALSGSLLLKCMDGTVRDLAALRGTYRLIDKTEQAISMIGGMLEQLEIGEAVFYLDAPVSNSGRLAEQIRAALQQAPFAVRVEVIHDVDVTLEKLDNVITSDAIILDKCISWINLNSRIIEENIGAYPYVDFSVLNRKLSKNNF